MSLLHALPLLLSLAQTGETGWQKSADTDGVTVYSRERKDNSIRELKAVGVINAPPQTVWKVLRDYPNYKNTMPYMKSSNVIGVEEGGKITYLYSIVSAPLISQRDYVLKITDDSDWQDGKGFLKSSWTAANDKGPPETKNMVRIKVNEGSWKLEPKDDGKRTLATYYLFTDPGGSVPRWMVNKANGSAVPNVFRALKKHSGAAK